MEISFHCIFIRVKRKRIYYVPGIISLIGLPILVLLFLHRDHQPIQPVSKRIKFFLPSDRPDEPYISRFSKQNFLNRIKGKKVLEIDLNEPADSNRTFIMERKRAFITRKIEELQFLHDTTAVVKVDFDDINTFSDFMWILMEAKAYQLKTYAYFDNSFYLLGTPPPAPPTNELQIEPLYM